MNKRQRKKFLDKLEKHVATKTIELKITEEDLARASLDLENSDIFKVITFSSESEKVDL